MKKGLTELVTILDKSGSMFPLVSDAVGGFNQMIESQKKIEGECLVTTVLFNDSSYTLYDRVDIKEIRQMKEKDFNPEGCTALIDCLGETIKKFDNIYKYIRPEDIPEKTIFFITTDGMENASKKYTSTKIKSMIKAKKKEGWEFIFAAANIDAVRTAYSYGINKDDTLEYIASKDGTKVMYSKSDEMIKERRKKQQI